MGFGESSASPSNSLPKPPVYVPQCKPDPDKSSAQNPPGYCSACHHPDGAKPCPPSPATNSRNDPPPANSKSPIRYSNGAVIFSHSDLTIPRIGFLGNDRSYYNQTAEDYDGPNGWNWFLRQFPYVCANGHMRAIVFDPNNPYWFKYDVATNEFHSLSSTQGIALTRNNTHELTFCQNNNGRTVTTVFHDMDSGFRPGQLISQTDSAGITTLIHGYDSYFTSMVARLQRTYSSGIHESLLYSYTSLGKIQSVTYRTSPDGSTWQHITQVVFGYYGYSDANGSFNDLKTSSEQVYNTATSAWDTVAVSYYRYYITSTGVPGFPHALKLVLGPEAYRQAFNASIDFDTATDADLKPYADHYFEYDSTTRAVTLEIAAVCGSCQGGGTSSDTFAITPRSGSFPTGYNVWSSKTVQTLPAPPTGSSATITVYSNNVGTPILRVYTDPNLSTPNQWYGFWRYDNNGEVIYAAESSAISGYSESFDDLVDWAGGTYVRPSSGLIHQTTRYDTGYVYQQSVSQGQSGTPVLRQQFTWTSNTSGGNTIYLPDVATEYPVAGSTSVSNSSTYTYTFSSANQVLTRQIVVPTVPSGTGSGGSGGQNGTGNTVTLYETYDVFGNLTSQTDARGIVNNYVYDTNRGLKIQQTLNYQSGVTTAGINSVTDYFYDDQGRLTTALGPPHTVVVSGTATAVRSATFYAYVQSVMPGSGTWTPDQVRSAGGYATGSDLTSTNLSDYTLTVMNPISINQQGKDGRATDQITSTRSSGVTGALTVSESLPQTQWQSWTNYTYNTGDTGGSNNGQLATQSVYFLIPSSGSGSVGTNYGTTAYGYDYMQRQNRILAPGGTITRMVYQSPQWLASTWVGTNDTGATDLDPTGGGAAGNNMVKVSSNDYDGGSAGGDGNLTQVTQYVSATSGDTRVTGYGYDFRDRQVNMTDATSRYTTYAYDNLDQLIETDQYASNGGNLIAKNISYYDNRRNVYQQVVYAVDPSTGSTGNTLIGNIWHDDGGNVIAQIGAGAGTVFTKNFYTDTSGHLVNWVVSSYQGYYSGSGTESPSSVSTDIILEQTINTYDEVGNIVSTASYQRLNDTSGTGALTTGTAPKGRASYMAGWFDGINRSLASANYGATSSFTRPTTPPSSSSTVLVNSTTYDGAGRVYETTDPAGHINQMTYDNAGRTTQVVESSSGLARTTNSTYTLDNLIATLQAVNSTTGNQTTTYTYGTTLTYSGVARNDLLAYVDYPDSVSGSDRVTYTYNRLSQQITITDQRGTVRTLLYDTLARKTHDCVTTNGTGTDVTVKRISTAYEVRGMAQTITSYNNATPGSGTVLNQVALTYNTFSQLIEEQQDHSTTVSGSTPKVQYGYDSGGSSSNDIRPSSITYPNGRVINYVYNSGMDSTLNRISAIQDTGTSLIDDNFNRANTTPGGAGSTTGAGNGWIDVRGGVYYINGDTLKGVPQGYPPTPPYQTNFLLRPASENVLNQQVILDVTSPAVSASSDQSAAVLRYQGGNYYMLKVNFVNGTNAADASVYSVVSGTATLLGTASFTAVNGHSYEISASAVGSSPTTLTLIVTDTTTSTAVSTVTTTDSTSGLQGVGQMGIVINSATQPTMTFSRIRTSSLTTNLAAYTYLGTGMVVRINYAEPGVMLDLWGGTSGTFNGFDLFNRIINQLWENSSSTALDQYKYGYDLNSNRQWKQNVVSSAASVPLDEYYTYDNLNRLIEMQRGTLNGTFTGISGTPVREMDYALDPTGNWTTYTTKTSGTTDLSQTRTSNAVNEITAFSGTPTWSTPPAYDDAGNMTTFPQPGTPTSSYTATYDAWNRMMTVSATGSPTYAYDGRGRRITATVSSTTRHFYYTNGWQDVEERLGSSTSMDKQNVWGLRYIDELVCRDDATPARYYAIQDANFNLTSICDTSGTVQERYYCDPYGTRTIMNSSWTVIGSSAYAWVIGFQGLMHDGESGLIYVRSSYVHPQLGVTILRDLFWPMAGMNAYEYLASGPTIRRDPFGTDPTTQPAVIQINPDDYFASWKIAHPGYSDQQYTIARNYLNSGCVGVLTINLAK
jgi:YD repeat-containing protein